MKILICHHVEQCWEYGLKGFGVNLYDLYQKIVDHIDAIGYDKVILTRFEIGREQFDDSHYDSGFAEWVDRVYEYAYGWPAECLTDDPSRFVPGGNHSEAVMIDDWIRDLSKHDVDLCGAFDGECIEDMEIALEACNVKFKRLNELIVG
jgi:hypothetical protein